MDELITVSLYCRRDELCNLYAWMRTNNYQQIAINYMPDDRIEVIAANRFKWIDRVYPKNS